MSANEFYTFHKSIFESWTHGDIAETWTDDAGNTCIRYESGRWWHYKTTRNGEIEFWQGGEIRPFCHVLTIRRTRLIIVLNKACF